METMIKSTVLHRRLNITLPEKTIRLIDRVAQKGDRSRLIAHAVERYIQEMGRVQLRERLKEGALVRAERDAGLAGEWFALEEELWRGHKR